MDKPSVVILFPDTNNQNAYLQKMKTFLEADISLRLHSALSLADMEAQVQESKYALAVFNVRNKADLVEVLNLLGTQADAIKKNCLRVIGSSALDHPEVVKILMKKGCADILPSDLSQKALRHKISQSFKILENYQSKLQLASDTEKRFRNEESQRSTEELHLAQEKPGVNIEFKQTQNSPKITMRLESDKGAVAVTPVEYSDREVWVEASRGSLNEGQRYKLIVECEVGGDASKEGFSAILKDIQVGEGTMDMMWIKILDDTVFPTESMNAALVRRQDEILDFMKSARGW
jgi:DNA-binding NarL/FixJ family response regulator